MKQKLWGVSADKKVFSIIGGILLLVITVLVCVFGVWRISNQLYGERAANLGMLMEKMTRNVSVVMESRQEHAEFVSIRLSELAPKSQPELFSTIGMIESWLSVPPCKVFVIDSLGKCYNQDGFAFHWPDASLLQGSGSKTYAGIIPQLGATDEQFFFISPLLPPLVVDGAAYTHSVVVYKMSSLDEYFEIENYGKESTAFILNPNGTEVLPPEPRHGFGERAQHL